MTTKTGPGVVIVPGSPSDKNITMRDRSPSPTGGKGPATRSLPGSSPMHGPAKKVDDHAKRLTERIGKISEELEAAKQALAKANSDKGRLEGLLTTKDEAFSKMQQTLEASSKAHAEALNSSKAHAEALNKVQTDNTELDAINAQLTQAKTSLEGRVRILESELGSHREELARIQSTVDSQLDKISKLTPERDRLQSDLEASKKELAESRTELFIAKTTIERQKNDIEEARKAGEHTACLRDLEVARTNLKSVKDAHEHEKTSYATSIKMKEGEIATLQGQLTKAEGDLEKAQKLAEGAEKVRNELHQLKQAHTDCETRIKALTDKQTQLTEEHEKAFSSLQGTKDTALTGARDEQARLAISLGAVRAELEAAQKDSTDLESRVKEAEGKLADSARTLQEREESLAKLQGELDQQIKANKDQLQYHTTFLDKMETDKTALETQRKEESEKQADHIRTLEGTLTEQSQKIAELGELLKKAKTDGDEVVGALQKELEELQGAYQQQSAELEAARAQLAIPPAPSMGPGVGPGLLTSSPRSSIPEQPSTSPEKLAEIAELEKRLAEEGETNTRLRERMGGYRARASAQQERARLLKEENSRIRKELAEADAQVRAFKAAPIVRATALPPSPKITVKATLSKTEVAMLVLVAAAFVALTVLTQQGIVEHCYYYGATVGTAGGLILYALYKGVPRDERELMREIMYA